MSNQIILPSPNRGIEALVKGHLDQLNYAIQGEIGAISAILSALGITQVQFGTFSFTGTSTTATFNAPFPDADYVLLMSPLFVAESISKTPGGFTVTIAGAGNIPIASIDFLAVE